MTLYGRLRELDFVLLVVVRLPDPDLPYDHASPISEY